MENLKDFFNRICAVENVTVGSNAEPYKVLDAKSHVIIIRQGEKEYSILGNIIE